MIAVALMRALSATGGMLITEGKGRSTPEITDLTVHTVEKSQKFGPERFRIELPEIRSLDDVTDALVSVCTELGADMKREIGTESYRGDQSNVTVVISDPEGRSFRAMIFVDNRLVDFRPFTS